MYREHGQHNIQSHTRDRFIPMCIGNTLSNLDRRFIITVYPYVYREHKTELELKEIDRVYPYVYREHTHFFICHSFEVGLSLCV